MPQLKIKTTLAFITLNFINQFIATAFFYETTFKCIFNSFIF
ncbi:hypothetical protein MuYL_3130 [Mucilaginibacter xinganensis]|uniref:Uncharacterized protein n=1 Tax=Mucilaginibacter xinganensis TaxID=1234841 RepID=A0A223NYR7_9SPHI|nr:hypothetical protein MuYL_3130 [Mucilaginibacter xinganensis]